MFLKSVIPVSPVGQALFSELIAELRMNEFSLA